MKLVTLTLKVKWYKGILGFKEKGENDDYYKADLRECKRKENLFPHFFYKNR